MIILSLCQGAKKRRKLIVPDIRTRPRHLSALRKAARMAIWRSGACVRFPTLTKAGGPLPAGGSRLQLPTNRLEFPETPAQRRQSLGEVLDARRSRAGLRPVGLLKLGEIARDALLDMGLPPRQLALGVVLLVRVQLKILARPKRFELLTPRFVVWCSIQLS